MNPLTPQAIREEAKARAIAAVERGVRFEPVTPEQNALAFDKLADALERRIADRRAWLVLVEAKGAGAGVFYADLDTPERRASIAFYRRKAVECRAEAALAAAEQSITIERAA